MKLFLPRAYLTLFILAGSHAIFVLVFNTAQSEFSGLFTILVTLPWSLLMTPLWNKLGVIEWYNQFAGQPLLYGFCAVLVMSPAACINTVILFFIGSKIDQTQKEFRRKD